MCDSPTHNTLNGKVVEMLAGWTLKAHFLCYTHVMLWTCTKYVTKYNKSCMSNTVKMLWLKVSIQKGIARLEELNEMFSYHLSFKSMEESSAYLPRMDKPYSELELHTLVPSALPSSIVLKVIGVSISLWIPKSSTNISCLFKHKRNAGAN